MSGPFVGCLLWGGTDDDALRRSPPPHPAAGRRAGAVVAGPLTVTAAPAALRRDGDRLLAFHGRIDNADELRRGGDAAGSGDAALVLDLLSGCGVDALARLRGPFALALWDGRSGRLTLAGDQLGLHTVFHARTADGLVLATSLRAVLAQGGVPRDLDDGHLAAFLTDATPEPDSTFYRAVRRVPPAGVVTVDRHGRVTVSDHWRPDWHRRIRHRRDEAYVEEARALLDQAVGRQLRGLGTVVCQLSGGLDSGAVASTAARLLGSRPLHALTMAPADGAAVFESPGRFADERPLAAAVARRHPNMVWESLSSDRLSPLDEDPLGFFLPLAMPCRNALNIGWFVPLFERARALGGRSVLTGSFGNLTLSWNGLPALADMVRTGRWLRAWREAAALGRRHGEPPARMLLRHGVKPLLSSRAQAWLDRRRGLPRPDSEGFSAINPDFARETAIAARRLAMDDDYAGDSLSTRRAWLRIMQARAFVNAAVGDMLGVELRDPTADLDLLAYCFAIPGDQYLRDGRTRWLARRVLADRLPPEVVEERRRGLQCPEFLQRITLARGAILDRLEGLERSPLASRVLDVKRLKALAEDWPTDPAGTRFHGIGAVLHRGVHVGSFLRWNEGAND